MKPPPLIQDDERSRWLASLRQKAADSEKSWWTVFVLSFVLGFFGVDRFYLGYPVAGCLKFITFGGGGFWWFADILLLCLNMMRDGYGGVVRRPF